MIGYVMIVATLIGCAVSPSYSVFLGCRLMGGIATASFLTYYILLTELLGPGYRSLPTITGSCSFGMGFPVLALSAYFVQNWRVLVLLGAAMILCCAPLFW